MKLPTLICVSLQCPQGAWDNIQALCQAHLLCLKALEYACIIEHCQTLCFLASLFCVMPALQSLSLHERFQIIEENLSFNLAISTCSRARSGKLIPGMSAFMSHRKKQFVEALAALYIVCKRTRARTRKEEDGRCGMQSLTSDI